MEWMIPVNDMLKDQITKINYTLKPPGFHGDARSVRIVQESLGKLIDSLGEQSALSQGLSKSITTAEKLQNCPTHYLYLLKDPAGNNGNGELIGFLKVAYKHLYLFDEREKVCQVEPLCVMDFFVSAACQRRGYGKMLFDFMLLDNATRPEDLAVDGPSSMMKKFLAKNYGLDRLMRQSNNFAVSPAFFLNNSENSKSGRSTPMSPAAAAVGRFTARKPQSSISDVIHGVTDRVYVESSYGTPEDAWEPELRPAPPSEGPPAQEPPAQGPPAQGPPAQGPPAQEPPAQGPPAQGPPAQAPSSRPSTLPVAPAVKTLPEAAGSATPRRASQLTDQGYFDVKFYHNKLW